MHKSTESFWKALPTAVERARTLWQAGHVSTANRIAFEDQLFGLRQVASELKLHGAADVLATLEAFAVTVPLEREAAAIATPGIEAGLGMLEALCFRNVSIHRPALDRLLTQLSRTIASRAPQTGLYRPTFVPPMPSRRPSPYKM